MSSDCRSFEPLDIYTISTIFIIEFNIVEIIFFMIGESKDENQKVYVNESLVDMKMFNRDVIMYKSQDEKMEFNRVENPQVRPWPKADKSSTSRTFSASRVITASDV